VVRSLVLVNGLPGSGKSTLAGPLARELDWPLLGKDIVKEAIHRGFAPDEVTLDWSRRAGAAAFEVLWALAAIAPRAVIEAPLRPGSPHEGTALAGLDAQIVEVRCVVPRQVGQERYAQRHADARHAVHAITALTDALCEEFDGDLGVGPVIEVDTTDVVDVPALAERVRRLFG